MIWLYKHNVAIVLSILLIVVAVYSHTHNCVCHLTTEIESFFTQESCDSEQTHCSGCHNECSGFGDETDHAENDDTDSHNENHCEECMCTRVDFNTPREAEAHLVKNFKIFSNSCLNENIIRYHTDDLTELYVESLSPPIANHKHLSTQVLII